MAAITPGIEPFSGSYLDFKTEISNETETAHVFGNYEQSDPTCFPRPPPEMDAQVRSDWFDEMLKLMESND